MIKFTLAIAASALALSGCGKQSAANTQTGSEVKYVRPLSEQLLLTSPVADPLDYKQWCNMDPEKMPEGVGRTLDDIRSLAREIANDRDVPEDQIPWTCEASYEFLMNEKRIAIGSGIETVWPLVAFKNAEVLNVTGNVLKDLKPLTLMPKLKRVIAFLNRANHFGGRFPLTCPLSDVITCSVDDPLPISFN